MRGGSLAGPLSIEKVVPGKQSEQLGVEAGFLICAVGGVEVATAKEFTAKISQAKARCKGQDRALVMITFEFECGGGDGDGDGNGDEDVRLPRTSMTAKILESIKYLDLSAIGCHVSIGTPEDLTSLSNIEKLTLSPGALSGNVSNKFIVWLSMARASSGAQGIILSNSGKLVLPDKIEGTMSTIDLSNLPALEGSVAAFAKVKGIKKLDLSLCHKLSGT